MELIFRKAKEGDIPKIVKLLADDELGSKREDYKVPLPESYYDAFQNIVQDKNQELIILENLNKDIIGTLQLTFILFDIPRLKGSNRSSKNSQKFIAKFERRYSNGQFKEVKIGMRLVQLTIY